MSQALAWEAQYGKLPFDRFVLAKGDCTLSTQDMQKQWTVLTRQWLALDPTQRKLYHEEGFEVESLMPEDPRLITREQIEYALKPFQTSQERNLIMPEEVWLRTCYDPNLDDACQEMLECAKEVVDDNQILDNAALYNFGTSWHRVLERLPCLCDRRLDTMTLEDLDTPPAEDHPNFPLWDAAQREVVMMYLLDRQAIVEGLVTILWLDVYGECVWWYRLDPKNVLEFTGWMASTCGLLEMAWDSLEDSEHARQRREKGAVIDWMF